MGAGRERAILFDLDDTLIPEWAQARAALLATAGAAADRYGIPAEPLVETVRATAREHWRNGPERAFCVAVGISSWEGLWCRFEGSRPELRHLRSWAPTYRLQTWSDTLARSGCPDGALARRLAAAFPRERRSRHAVYPESVAVLTELRTRYRIGIVTNGAACLQGEKLAATGIGRLADTIVIAGALGVGKPDPRIFHQALADLGAPHPGDAVMVGDHPERDIAGAQSVGLRAVWIQRHPQTPPPRPTAVPRLEDLRALPDLLNTWWE